MRDILDGPPEYEWDDYDAAVPPEPPAEWPADELDALAARLGLDDEDLF